MSETKERMQHISIAEQKSVYIISRIMTETKKLEDLISSTKNLFCSNSGMYTFMFHIPFIVVGLVNLSAVTTLVGIICLIIEYTITSPFVLFPARLAVMIVAAGMLKYKGKRRVLGEKLKKKHKTMFHFLFVCLNNRASITRFLCLHFIQT
jgi:hypothetical protein